MHVSYLTDHKTPIKARVHLEAQKVISSTILNTQNTRINLDIKCHFKAQRFPDPVI